MNRMSNLPDSHRAEIHRIGRTRLRATYVWKTSFPKRIWAATKTPMMAQPKSTSAALRKKFRAQPDTRRTT